MKLSLYIVFFFTLLCSSFTLKKDPIEANPIATAQNKIDRDSIIVYAKQYLGIPYLYAGNDPKKGFDCSGFVNYIFKNYGITLPRSSSGFKNLGTKLAPEDFKVGDVCIICEANGMHSKFIHASSGKAGSVTISDLDSDHYSKRYYKCINVLP